MNKFADKQLAPLKAALKAQADSRIDQSPSLNNKVKEFSKETTAKSTNAIIDLSRRTLIAIAFSSFARKKKKSLLVYNQKYAPFKLIRANTMNVKHDDNIYNYPLYLISGFPLKSD